MKTRFGHVSNSSTASFICKTDMTVEELDSVILRLFQDAGIDSTLIDYNGEIVSCWETLEFTEESRKKYFVDSEWVNYYNIPLAENGMLMIFSTEDNSIPGEIMDDIINLDKIEDIHHYHLE